MPTKSGHCGCTLVAWRACVRLGSGRRVAGHPWGPPCSLHPDRAASNGLPRARCSLRAGTRAEAPPTGTRLPMPQPVQKQACMWVNMVSLWCTARGSLGHCGVGQGQPPRPPLTCCWGRPGRRPGPSRVPIPPVPDRSLVLPDQGVEVSRCPALDAKGAVEGVRCRPRGCQRGTRGYSALPWRGAALAPPRCHMTAPGKRPWVSVLLSLRHGHLPCCCVTVGR